MTFEPIGLITLVVGLLILRRGPDFGLIVMASANLLGTAAAVKLPALGGANILVAHFLLPFYTLAISRSTWGTAGVLAVFFANKAGFVLLCFAFFAVIGAVFLPRIFAGQIEVFSISRDSLVVASIVSSPLRFSAANLTQTVYMVGDFLLFACVAAHVCNRGPQIIVTALMIAATVNVFLGVADAATYFLYLEDLLAPIRNANYAIATEGGLIGGIRRTIGSFAESSVYGAASLALFAVTLEFYIVGIRRPYLGLIAFASFLALIFSMSSSALAGLVVYSAILLVRGGFALVAGQAHIRFLVLMIASVCVALTLMLIVTTSTLLSTWSGNVVDHILFSKLESQSGIERTLWNVAGFEAFWQSGMLGAGTGSIRTSSYVVAILANTGLIGFILMLAFYVTLTRDAYLLRAMSLNGKIARGLFWAGVAAMLGPLVTGSTVGFGMRFAILAGGVVGLAAAGSAVVGQRTGWNRYNLPGLGQSNFACR
ncbi:MAG: hypothetical protein AAFV69_09265 [Pseudomonadota bacterium]